MPGDSSALPCGERSGGPGESSRHSLHVKSGPSESLARDMREGELDVALTVSGAAPRDERQVSLERGHGVGARAANGDRSARPGAAGQPRRECLAHRQVAMRSNGPASHSILPFTKRVSPVLLARSARGSASWRCRAACRKARTRDLDDAPLPRCRRSYAMCACDPAPTTSSIHSPGRWADAFGVRAAPAPDHAAG